MNLFVCSVIKSRVNARNYNGEHATYKFYFNICFMESKRQNKFSRLLQKELGEIFQRDQKHLFHNTFITVTKVNVSPDLGVAKVYLSFLMVKDVDQQMHRIEMHKKDIRKQLGNRISNQVRKVPELVFFHDDSSEYAAKIDSLLANLDIPPADDEKNQQE
jgi:ribosome-binding factor A